jgi:hypothetical protein
MTADNGDHFLRNGAEGTLVEKARQLARKRRVRGLGHKVSRSRLLRGDKQLLCRRGRFGGDTDWYAGAVGHFSLDAEWRGQ